jgi:hypothetical protein
VDDNAGLAELVELNRDLQGCRAIRLLATTNLGVYATLMERHLADGAVPETELVVRLERDLDGLDDPQSGLALIKSWASQGWLHRIVDERHDQNVCYLTQDARRALDFLRGMRRQDTIATGGSITGIAARLKQVAPRVDNDPARIRKHIEAEITANPPTMGVMAATSCNPRVVSCAAPTNPAVHPAVANAMAIRSPGASRSAGGESSNVNAAMMKPAPRSRRQSRTAVAVSICCLSIDACPHHRF